MRKIPRAIHSARTCLHTGAPLGLTSWLSRFASAGSWPWLMIILCKSQAAELRVAMSKAEYDRPARVCCRPGQHGHATEWIWRDCCSEPLGFTCIKLETSAIDVDADASSDWHLPADDRC